MGLEGYVGGTIADNTFYNNVMTGGSAGALFIYTQRTLPIEMSSNVFEGNSASSTGGAVYWASNVVWATQHTIADNVFTDNTSTSAHGGALLLQNVNVDVERNTASGNTATFGGFAFMSTGGTIRAENNSLIENDADTGAGWYVSSGVTFAENGDTVASISSDASTAMWAVTDATVSITNSIYWNPLLTLSELYRADSVSYTCSSTDSATLTTNLNTVGAGMVYDDPLFVDLASGSPDIGADSPCVDAADTATAPADDYYWTTRPIDGDGDGTADADMGCVEFETLTIPIEEDGMGVYFGRLIRGVGAAYSGGAYVYGYSKAPYTGTRFETSFTGSKVRWIGPKQPNYGQAKVYIDGVYKATVDCYAAPGDAAISATLWESAALSDGSHTIAIEMGSTKNASSTNYIVVIDKLEVDGINPSGPMGIRENESLGTFIGGWVKNLPNTTYTYGTYSYSYWAGARFVRNFYGTRVAWVGPKIFNYGRAAVYIDGVYKGTVSQYAPGDDIGFRRKVWESAVLPAGNHTFEIRVLGTKDAASTGTFIVVDSIDVTGAKF
jgi:hypothetical protein